jgi:hypothetical protein
VSFCWPGDPLAANWWGLGQPQTVGAFEHRGGGVGDVDVLLR